MYNLQEKGTVPILRSTAKSGKHSDPVWQVNIIFSLIYNVTSIFLAEIPLDTICAVYMCLYK